MLCKIETFNDALELSLSLFSEEYFAKKNLTKDKLSSPPIENLIKFLSYISDNIKNEKIDDYSKLMNVLNDVSDKNFLPLFGYLGKILDGIQLLKDNSFRSRNAMECFKNNLRRTSHDYILEKFPTDTLGNLYAEIKLSSSLYILLEASHLAYTNTDNPISSLRRSMGDRLPEEYFSELLSGWAIEHYFLTILKKHKINALKIGTDNDFTIKFSRSKDMGESDIQVKLNNVDYFLEIQRVGKATKDKSKLFKTFLKAHKTKKEDNIVNILWFGKEPKKIASANSKLHDRIIFVRNSDINESDNLKWDKENLYFNESFLDKNSIIGIENFSQDNFETLLKGSFND